MTDLQIRVHGWSVVLVEDERPWAYTIGVLESFGHPELVVTDLEPGSAQALINAVGEVVRAGNGRPDPERLQAMGVSLVEVAPRHVRSHLFDSWRLYHGEAPRPGDFVQILHEALCDHHRDAYRRLDRV